MCFEVGIGLGIVSLELVLGKDRSIPIGEDGAANLLLADFEDGDPAGLVEERRIVKEDAIAEGCDSILEFTGGPEGSSRSLWGGHSIGDPNAITNVRVLGTRAHDENRTVDVDAWKDLL
jgi:hypothetical protein